MLKEKMKIFLMYKTCLYYDEVLKSKVYCSNLLTGWKDIRYIQCTILYYTLFKYTYIIHTYIHSLENCDVLK